MNSPQEATICITIPADHQNLRELKSHPEEADIAPLRTKAAQLLKAAFPTGCGITKESTLIKKRTEIELKVVVLNDLCPIEDFRRIIPALGFKEVTNRSDNPATVESAR